MGLVGFISNDAPFTAPKGTVRQTFIYRCDSHSVSTTSTEYVFEVYDFIRSTTKVPVGPFTERKNTLEALAMALVAYNSPESVMKTYFHRPCRPIVQDDEVVADMLSETSEQGVRSVETYRDLTPDERIIFQNMFMKHYFAKRK